MKVLLNTINLRDRPFNLKGGLWFFVSFRIFFSDNTRVRIFTFFRRAKREFFSQNLTLGYMTKILNPIFFPLHQNQNIFFSNIGNQNIFFLKTITPPFKLNCRSLTLFFFINMFIFAFQPCFCFVSHPFSDLMLSNSNTNSLDIFGCGIYITNYN